MLLHAATAPLGGMPPGARGPWCRAVPTAAAGVGGRRPHRRAAAAAAAAARSEQQTQQWQHSRHANTSSSSPSSILAAAAAQHGPSSFSAAATAVALPLALLLAADPAAAAVHMEPANALSLPTWAVHTSSVIEWVIAMGLMWRYGEVSGNPRWKGMAWGMLPSLGSAMCACTWHLFYNSPDLQFLVALQGALTIVGNATCWWAAYRIYAFAQEQEAA